MQIMGDEVLMLGKEFLIMMGSAIAAKGIRNRVTLTRKVVKASAATSKEPLSIQSKKRQKMPFVLCGLSLSMAMIPRRLEPGSSPSS